jgi:hypothetical protein
MPAVQARPDGVVLAGDRTRAVLKALQFGYL